jgi:hypothetical protein
MVLWSVLFQKKTKTKTKPSKQSKSSKPEQNSFEQDISRIMKFSTGNKAVKETVSQWLTQYENISALQVRLLQSNLGTKNTKQDFAHQMIEKQKQEIEKNSQELLLALNNKDLKDVERICNLTLEKAEAVQRAMFQDRDVQ